MGRKKFISKTHYDRYQKFKCPLRIGFWHYSPNGCCLFINDRTQTIHHLYLRENCTLTRDGDTIHNLLHRHQYSNGRRHRNNNATNIACDTDVNMNTVNGGGNGGGDDDGDDDDEDYDYDDDDCNTNNRNNRNKFLPILIQPYINNNTFSSLVDQRMLTNMSNESKYRLLQHTDEMLQQSWFVVCDFEIEIDKTVHNFNDSILQHLVLKYIFSPLVFCSSLNAMSIFLQTVTNRFIHQQMPVLNNIPGDRLLRHLRDNIKFISQFPAQRMIQFQSSSDFFYMDARDLFDVVKLGNSGYLTNMRSLHLTNEANFLDTWRRILFNFVHELTNIHDFASGKVRVTSTCDVAHFIKGNNKSVLPEFRCDTDDLSKCIHLKTRRKEYEMFRLRNNMSQPSAMFGGFSHNTVVGINSCNSSNSNSIYAGQETTNKGKYTIALSDEGVICRHVLETLVDEYGEDAVNQELRFNCYFSNAVFEHENARIWERMIYESTGIDKKLSFRDGTALTRERIACMQELCKERRMNDIHRFCLPRRFLTLLWFKWASDKLKMNTFTLD